MPLFRVCIVHNVQAGKRTTREDSTTVIVVRCCWSSWSSSSSFAAASFRGVHRDRVFSALLLALVVIPGKYHNKYATLTMNNPRSVHSLPCLARSTRRSCNFVLYFIFTNAFKSTVPLLHSTRLTTQRTSQQQFRGWWYVISWEQRTRVRDRQFMIATRSIAGHHLCRPKDGGHLLGYGRPPT